MKAKNCYKFNSVTIKILASQSVDIKKKKGYDVYMEWQKTQNNQHSFEGE